MQFLRLITMAAACIFLNNSCKKESTGVINCDLLKQGFLLNNKTIITNEIGFLLTDYNESNLNKLAAAISTQCDMEVSVLCFDCVQTLPSQSEILFRFVQSNIAYEKGLDISYTPDNKMVIRGLHE